MSEIDFIQLNQSRAIEASAGTGKTYTLERIVLKLLMAQPHELINPQPNSRLSIEELVLVTFTDKAAGELKERIRMILEETIVKFREELSELESSSTRSKELIADILHLEDNLNKIDQANISTIHGFCLKVLKTYAFESKANFGLDLIQDDEGLKSELRKFLRRDSFQANEERKSKLWQELTQSLVKDEEAILKLAKEFLSGTLVSKEGLENEDFDGFYEDALAGMQSEIDEIQSAKQDLFEYAQNSFSQFEEIRSLEVDPKKNESATAQKFLTFIDLMIETIPNSDENSWFEFLKKTTLVNKAPAHYKAYNEFLSNFKNDCELTSRSKSPMKVRLKPLLDHVDYLHPDQLIKPYAFTYTASKIANEWAKKKTLKGQISFDDMIRLVSEAVCDPKGLLRKKLQEVFRYGIIDEFQDTDAKQWSIFEKIFLESPRHVLYVVGDSKQSIYKFRGADLRTFDAALRKIALKGGQEAHNLDSNYRSTPQMIQSYNQLFSAKTPNDNFFKFAEEDKVYHPVKSGFQDQPQAILDKIFKSNTATWSPEEYQDSLQGDSAIFYVDVQAPNSPTMYRQYAKKVASHLFDLILKSQSTNSPLKPNQIAVLYQSHARSREIREELEKFGLPCAIYKDEGVFQSTAALQWILLMEGLSSTQTLSQEVKKAFLTQFLRVNPEVLSDSQNWSKHSSIQNALKKLDHWRSLLRRSEWGVLFESILRESQVMTYLQANESDSDRAIADLHQVMEWMIDYLASHKGTWEGLILKLRAFYHQTLNTPSDQNLFILESERESIQFMTMHASKGLEFPVVVNVLKATDNFKDEPYKVIQIEPGEKSIYWKPKVDLPESFHEEGTVEERFKLERYQEMSRLYYVSFTRASLFQYIPVFLNNKATKTNPTPKHKWPFDVIAQAANDQYIPTVDIPSGTQWIVEAQEEEKVKIPGLTQSRSEILSQQKKVRKMPFQTSYSDLAHGAEGSDKGSDDEQGSLLKYTPEIRREIASQTSLIPGNKTGDLLHNLFELSDWSEVMNFSVEQLSTIESPTLVFTQLLIQELKKASLWTSDETLLQARCIETTKIIKHTLECIIDEPETDYDLSSLGLSQTFRLGELAKADILPEMEFQFSFGEDAELFGENSQGGGWVKGFMDLVFRRPTSDGYYRYYVLDWKSNALVNYTQDEISKSMLDSHYDVQAKLYQLAMHEWLKEAYGDQYSPEKFLGGAIYAYVRGNHEQPNKDSFLNYPLNLEQVDLSREGFAEQIKHHKKFNSGVQ